MPVQLFANNASDTLSASITDSATGITVSDGTMFPYITGSDFFYLTLDDDVNVEIIKVTVHDSGTPTSMTVVRGQQGTTASAFADGVTIQLRVTKDILEKAATSIDGLTVKDEGSDIPNTPHSALNFVGGKVAVTDAGGGVADVTVTTPIASEIAVTPSGNLASTEAQAALQELQGDIDTINAGGKLVVKDEGTNVTGTPHTAIDFVGAGVTVTDGGSGNATITIPGGGGGGALNDLSDVFNSSPADKHVIIYDGVTDNRYENRALSMSDVSDAGTAATLNVGTAANNVVQLDGTAKLPAVDGSQLTNLPGGGGGGDGKFIGANVFRDTAQTLSNATSTAVNFTKEAFDTDGWHDNVTNNNRVTVDASGHYLIQGFAAFVNNGTGNRQLWIQVNGTDIYNVDFKPAVSGSALALNTSVVLSLSANDYIELIAYQSSGGNLDLTIASGAYQYPRLTVTRMLGIPDLSNSTFSGVSLFHTGVQSIPNATETAINFANEDFDTDSYHDNVTNNTRITAAKAGYYYVSGVVRFDANSTGVRVIWFRKNGADTIGAGAHVNGYATTPVAVHTARLLFLEAGDYVELFAWQDSGGALNTSAANANHYPRFSMHKVSGQNAGAAADYSGASAFHNAQQSIPNSTNTVLNFNSEEFDTDAYHDNVTNNSRLTVTTSGKYLITGRVNWVANGTGTRELRLKKNGSTNLTSAAIPGTAGQETSNLISHVVDLAVNDYVELHVFQSSGGALNTYTGGDPNWYPRFTITKLVGSSLSLTVSVKTANHTATGVDNGRVVEMNSASAMNFTIPTDATENLPVGFNVVVTQIGAGQVTFVDTGVTLRSKSSNKKLTAQYSSATLYKRGANDWLLSGDLSA